ncbi:MAG TPA: 1-phosphofructokinase family hexose kinase [Thermoanaerobaculia bacterium]|nr:1-phosphofructokinase family hexose kinase [Thermoanaerobaculia bacterium]
MGNILTVTLNPTIDVNTSVAHVEPDHKLRCAKPSREPGGGGVNVARAIRRLGGEVSALFTAGGAIGSQINELLGEEGVQQLPIPVAEESRESVNVLEQSTARQFRFVMPGPELQEHEWGAVLEAVRYLEPRPGYVVASGSLPPGAPVDFYGRLSEIVSEIGSRLIVDTSGEPLQHALGKGTFLLKPNIREFRQFAGGDTFSDRFLEGAALSLVSSGRCSVVVISLGAGGALVVHGGGFRRIAAPTVKIESRVGAGDSMVAGMVLALSRGFPIEEAAQFGVASGTAAVMTPGTELCRREDAERLYEEMKAAEG